MISAALTLPVRNPASGNPAYPALSSGNFTIAVRSHSLRLACAWPPVNLKTAIRRLAVISAIAILPLLGAAGQVWASGGGGHSGGGHGGGHGSVVQHSGGHLAAGFGHGGGHHGGHHLGGHIGVFVGPAPYYYPPPHYYPYPPITVAPSPPVYIERNDPQPGAQTYYWYYCANPEGYYPYVQECPGGWKQVIPPPVS